MFANEHKRKDNKAVKIDNKKGFQAYPLLLH